MFKTHDVMELISEGIHGIDGSISDKQNDDGTYDLYDTKTETNGNTMTVTLSTLSPKKIEHDKYKITIEPIE